MTRPFLQLLAILSAVILPGMRAFGDTAFDSLLATDPLWALDQPGFEKATPRLPFRWTSSARDSARAAEPGMTLLGLPLTEVVARFEQGKLTQITANIYARGDAGDLSEARFKALLVQAIEAIGKSAGVKQTVRGKDPKNAVKAEGIMWATPKGRRLMPSMC